MTGYTVHTGASEKFVSGWDRIFSEGGGKQPKGKSKATAKASGGKKKRAKTDDQPSDR